MSPFLQKPLELGADIVLHSATKFLSGHADLTGGLVVCRRQEVAERIEFLQNAEGAVLGPWDSWLLLRGIDTLAVRQARQEQTTTKIAEFLGQQPDVAALHWIDDPKHPDQLIHLSQASGFGSVFSLSATWESTARRLVEATKLFRIAVSFGSVHSTISLPSAMSHASIPTALREQHAPAHEIVRLSIGLEDPEDLIADLQAALGNALSRGHDRKRSWPEAI